MRHLCVCVVLGAVLAGCDDGDPGLPRLDAAATPADTAATAPDALAAVLSLDAAVTGVEAGPPDASLADVPRNVPADAAAIQIPADASAAAPVPGTMVVGSGGGTLEINEGKLFIPAGALAANTTIVFRTVSSGYPALPGRAFSSVVSLEPAGQSFAQPVALTLYHFGGAARVALYTAAPGGTFAPVANATITLNTGEAALTRFGYFVVAPAMALPDAAADAASLPADAAAPDAGGEAALQADTGLATDLDGADTAADAAVSPDLTPDAPPPKLDTGAATVPVAVRGEVLSFDPKIATIKVGDTVTWTWEAANNHSVVSGGGGGPGDCASDGKFNSGVKGAGGTFSFTFTAAGMYPYHCAAHCTQFEGGVIVVQ